MHYSDTGTFCQPSGLGFNCRVLPKEHILISHAASNLLVIPQTHSASLPKGQSHQVPAGEESFTHRNYLLEGRSTVWLWPLEGTQADTAKICFYRLQADSEQEGSGGRWNKNTHFSALPSFHPTKRALRPFPILFLCTGKTKAQREAESPLLLFPSHSLLYIKKARIYLAKMSQPQSFLFKGNVSSEDFVLTKCQYWGLCV